MGWEQCVSAETERAAATTRNFKGVVQQRSCCKYDAAVFMLWLPFRVCVLLMLQIVTWGRPTCFTWRLSAAAVDESKGSHAVVTPAYCQEESGLASCNLSVASSVPPPPPPTLLSTSPVPVMEGGK